MKQAYPAVANALEIISDDNNHYLELAPIREIRHLPAGTQPHYETPQYPWWEANITDGYRYSSITHTS